jgi:hypothetical protein
MVGLIRQVIAPLAQAIGEWWRRGELTVAQEHCASAAIRDFLAQNARPFGGSEGAPVLAVATPSGQVHELGALIVAAMAGHLGWRVTYLGPSLPAPDLAGAVQRCQARALALSLVYPEDDPALGPELQRLRDWLPPETALVVGGRAAPAYQRTLDAVGAITTGDLGELEQTLDSLRNGPPRAACPRTGAGGG